MKTMIQNKTLLLMLVVMSLFSACKKKDSNSPADPTPSTPSTPAPSARLVIDNGARALPVGNTINYTAKLIKADGTITNLSSGVTWTSSNANAGSFSGSVFTASAGEITIVKASYTLDGVTYTAEVPLTIQIPNTSVFAVLPSAIVFQAGSETIALETIYIGSGSASYAFSSDNTGVANVTSAGVVSFISAGQANITVAATINGQTSNVIVPVLVVGAPAVILPVAKVVVTPKNLEMFKSETQQYVAKAYDSNGNDVSANYTFNWSVTAKDADFPMPVSINSTGMVTATNLGGAYVSATAAGITGQAELNVNPDTVIMVNPFYVSLGGFDPITLQPNPTSQNLTATTYKVDRVAYKAGQSNFLNQITNPSNLAWMVPLTGIPAIDSFYDIVDLTNQTSSGVTVTKKASAMTGGSTFVVAHVPGTGIEPGISAITIMP
ncbi:MAG: hypothetical protein JNJ40_01215 [Bacteroidia bacterium]|nr:hypothetical protein [Bacteroidia bacterium]